MICPMNCFTRTADKYEVSDANESTEPSPEQLELWAKQHGMPIEHLLHCGAIRLLNACWIVKFARSKRALPPRQHLPEAAFVTVEQLQQAMPNIADYLRIVVLSYAWLTPEHPDPLGQQLVNFCAQVEQARRMLRSPADACLYCVFCGCAVPLGHGCCCFCLPRSGQECGRCAHQLPSGEMAVFYDYGSLYQKCPRTGEPRTAMENAAFKAALSRMQVWYAHQLTTCFFMTEPPAGSTALRYTERGWPTFEYQVSMLAKTWTSSGWPQLFDVGRGVDKLFVRPPPLSTEALLELLQTKCFTNGAVSGLRCGSVDRAPSQTALLE